jgi:hypothetical protein
MKITVEPSEWRGSDYIIRLTQGHQSFNLDYNGTKEDCLWYAKMFRIALKAHDIERAQAQAKSGWSPSEIAAQTKI